MEAAVGDEGRRRSDGEEHADDPWGEEEVDADGVVVLAADGLEEEGAFEGVGGEDGDEGGDGEEPEDEVDGGGDVEEAGGGAGGEGAP